MKLANRLQLRNTGPWSLARISTALWLDASDADTATIVGGKISQRADKSGNSRHATQSIDGYRPLAGINKDDFDGTDDRLSIAHTSALNAPVYIAVVVKPAMSAQYHGLLDKWDNEVGWMIDFGVAGSIGQPRVSVNNGAALLAPTNTNSIISIIEIQINGASSFIGGPAGVSTGALQAPTSNTQDIFIAGDGTSTLVTDLDFHEMAILGSAPDSATRAKIQGYLAHKWDTLLGVSTLVSALPVGHPYKTSAP